MTITPYKNKTQIIAAAVVGMMLFSNSVYSATIQDSDSGLAPTRQDQDEKSQDQKKAKQDQDGEKGDAKQADAKKAEPPKPFIVRVGEDSIEFTVSGTWKQVKPKSGMIEAEIAIPKLDDDQQDGRLTIMGAGGTIEANVVRWQDQFIPEGGTQLEVKRETKKINDQTVHWVDMSGTYVDSPGGPFSGQPKVERKNYRMLAAIVETKSRGNYFLKLYGPANTMEKNAERFKEMVESLKVAE